VRALATEPSVECRARALTAAETSFVQLRRSHFFYRYPPSTECSRCAPRRV